jgi:hypothetical protein
MPDNFEFNDHIKRPIESGMFPFVVGSDFFVVTSIDSFSSFQYNGLYRSHSKTGIETLSVKRSGIETPIAEFNPMLRVLRITTDLRDEYVRNILNNILKYSIPTHTIKAVENEWYLAIKPQSL